MTTHRLARIYKLGTRWHWTLILAGPGDASHAHVYQGHEATWALALATFKFVDFIHGAELDNLA